MSRFLHTAKVGDLPVVWLEPDALPTFAASPAAASAAGAADSRRRLVIFLTGFGGDRLGVVPYLERLADAGFVALSFDPYQHGDRLLADRSELQRRIAGNIRRYFWPILGETTRETGLILDWSVRELGVADRIGIGGISMGGDIACAAAGEHPRIVAAACGIATPDWLRPGSFEPPGEPDSYARALYRRYNPLTRLDAYAHCPAITFQNGADDRQVPPDGSVRFVQALHATHYASCPERIEAVLHPGVGHVYTPTGFANSVAWFTRWLAD